jgi:hypothetical protein
VTRLIVLVGTPYHLRAAEAEEWLRSEASGLATVAGVRRAVLSPLASPSLHWSDEWGWLIEIDCENRDDMDRVVRDGAWTDLLGDLRLLGMRPTVAVVGDASELRS